VPLTISSRYHHLTKSQKVSEFRKNEDEYTTIIKQLTTLAKEQKVRLRELECKITLSANIYDVSLPA
jgi:glycine cleavage system regulatory protein